MATRNKNDLVQCEYCGEKYSTTYKRCPFCDGTGNPENAPDDTRRGGKRLAGRGGSSGPGWSLGSIVWGIVSLVIIIAAICIVVSTVKSFLGGEVKPTPTSIPSSSQPVVESSEPTPSAEPSVVPSVEPSVEPTVDPSLPTDFTLSKSDFSLFKSGDSWTIKVTFTPASAKAPVVWSTSNPKVATVSENGKVVAVGKGTCTIKATVEGVGEKTCIVRCNFKSSDATPAPDPTPTPSSTSSTEIKINKTDFTLFHAGETARLRISGTTSTVVWSSSDTDVATVDKSGQVTAMGKGTCTITATVDGQTFKCIVRCRFQSE